MTPQGTFHEGWGAYPSLYWREEGHWKFR
jgi:hypothetical protein